MLINYIITPKWLLLAVVVLSPSIQVKSGWQVARSSHKEKSWFKRPTHMSETVLPKKGNFLYAVLQREGMLSAYLYIP